MSITDFSTAVTANSTGVVVTSDASTAHTKGAWVELIASNSEETYWTELEVKGLENDESYLIDVGVDEVVKIANIPLFGNTGVLGGLKLLMPLTVPSGASVSIRCQATATSKTMEAMVYLMNNVEFGTSTVNETIGVNTGTSTGTDIDPGGTNNVKGGYTQLIAGTAADYNYFIIILGNSDNNGQINQQILVDIGVGATPSAVIENITFFSFAGEDGSTSASYFQTIASGAEISAQSQSTDTSDANDRLIDVAMLGFNLVAPAGGSASGVRNPFSGPIG